MESAENLISTFNHISLFLLPSNNNFIVEPRGWRSWLEPRIHIRRGGRQLRRKILAGIAQLVRAQDSYPPWRTAVEKKNISRDSSAG